MPIVVTTHSDVLLLRIHAQPNKRLISSVELACFSHKTIYSTRLIIRYGPYSEFLNQNNMNISIAFICISNNKNSTHTHTHTKQEFIRIHTIHTYKLSIPYPMIVDCLLLLFRPLNKSSCVTT